MMTTKKRSSWWSSVRRLLRRGRSKVAVVLYLSAALLCFLALLRLHSQYAGISDDTPTTVTALLHSFNNYRHFEGSPKVAFLFLARQSLPLDFVWHTFFKNGDVSKFSIYIHSKPGFVFNEATTRSAFFYDRQLKHSVLVGWGDPTMIEAERLLLEAALDDPANQRFVLLSDSCVPLYNFSYVYNYLMSSPRSFVDSFFDAKDDRYNPKMSPLIPKRKWRKGSQWITLVRRHAEVVVNDNIVFPVFKKFCRPRRRSRFMFLRNVAEIFFRNFLSRNNCVSDEHYVQTLLNILSGVGLEAELARRTLTYSSWNHSAAKSDKKSWHPITFQFADASRQRIREIKDIDHVYHKSEDRTEWCGANSTSAPCFLFARKFSRGAALRLLITGVVGPYPPTTTV